MISSLERNHVCLNMRSRSITCLLQDALFVINGSLYGEIGSAIEEFIGHYRCHIRMEEETIFQLIRNLARSVEWRTDVECMLHMSTDMHLYSGARSFQH